MSVPRRINLARDVLDKQLLDRDRNRTGRADGIVIEIDPDPSQPPRIVNIESGGAILSRRLHPRIEHWFRVIARRFGLRRGQATRIPWDKVESIGIHVKLDVAREALPSFAWEGWLRDHVILRIPFRKPGKDEHE